MRNENKQEGAVYQDIINQDKNERTKSEIMKERWETPEWRQFMLSKLRGREFSQEHKNKIKANQTGRKLTEETKKKMSQNHVGMTGRRHNPNSKKMIGEKNRMALKRYHEINPEARKVGLRNFKKGHGWNKGKQLSEETKAKISKNRKGIKLSKEWKENIKKGQEGMRTKEWLKKCLKRHPKSSLEIKFEELTAQTNFPLFFCGNGEVIVAKKCPDFADKDGKKIAIEVYCRKHKDLFRGGVEEWIEERQKIFNQEGWTLLFFDETEVNKDEIITKLGGIYNRP